MNSLHQLAHFKGILTEYLDFEKKRTRVPDTTLVRLLQTLGVTIDNEATQAAHLLSQEKLRYWQRPLEPVVVAWDGQMPKVILKLARGAQALRASATITLEDGSIQTHELEFCERQPACTINDHDFETACLAWPAQILPAGYHRLDLTWESGVGSCHVISAPREAYSFTHHKLLGVFAPMYAMRSQRNWGAGDLTDFEQLLSWTQQQGGHLLGTLPLLAQFLGQPFLDPSPYAPASRLFWNEFFLDIEGLPEFQSSKTAQAQFGSSEFQAELEKARHNELVDYGHVAQLKRQILETLAQEFWGSPSTRAQAFQSYLQAHPEVQQYARFRARCDRDGSWHTWQNRSESLDVQLAIQENDPAYRYYAYTQWLMSEKLSQLNKQAAQKAPGLYLDLPLGVHSDSFDTWKYRDQFLGGCTAGAPPDFFFRGGQNWGFQPLNPESQRETCYSYFRQYLTHHMKACGILRVDHVMGLNRLFCIPHELPVRDGTYIRYKAPELYAILSLESHRHQTVVIGEDLGVVPVGVRMAMDRHKLSRMYIAPFEWNLGIPKKHMNPIPAGSLVAMNTHDMPPFAGMLFGEDIRFQHQIGWISDTQERDLTAERRRFRIDLARAFGAQVHDEITHEDVEFILRQVYDHMADSPSPLFLLNIEDFWLEQLPQNVPGTWKEWPNWRQKLKWSQEQIFSSAKLSEWVQHLATLRQSH